MFTIVTLAAVPAFARGKVRDLRPRWALEEVGLPYATRTIDFAALKSPAFRASQPFNQVPVLEEEGRPPIFETGAMLVAIAERAGALLPAAGDARGRVLEWLFAGFSSIEPCLMNVAEVEVFLRDETHKAIRRPVVEKDARQRLGLLEAAMSDDYLAGDFSIADIVMATVLRIADGITLLDDMPKLAAYRARCEARPAFQRALEGQLTDIKEMKFG